MLTFVMGSAARSACALAASAIGLVVVCWTARAHDDPRMRAATIRLVVRCAFMACPLHLRCSRFEIADVLRRSHIANPWPDGARVGARLRCGGLRDAAKSSGERERPW